MVSIALSYAGATFTVKEMHNEEKLTDLKNEFVFFKVYGCFQLNKNIHFVKFSVIV